GRPQEASLELIELDVPSQKSRVTGSIAGRGNVWVRLSPDGSRLLALERPDRSVGLSLHDASSGARLATLVEPGAAGALEADFLADGRIAVAARRRELELHLFAPDGREERRVGLPRGLLARCGGGPAAGQLAVGLWDGTLASSQTLVVDLSTGQLLRREPGLLPLNLQSALYRDPSSRPAPGSPGTALRQSRSGVVS